MENAEAGMKILRFNITVLCTCGQSRICTSHIGWLEETRRLARRARVVMYGVHVLVKVVARYPYVNSVSVVAYCLDQA